MQRACAVRTPAMVAKARALWAEGLSLTAIAERLNTSRPTIKRALAGEAKPRADRMTPAIRAEVLRQHGDGVPKAHIARALGFSETTVRDVIELAEEQRAAAGAAHREGGTGSPVTGSALPPNSLALSLTQRGMRPEIAVIVARQWEERRHAQQHGARRR